MKRNVAELVELIKAPNKGLFRIRGNSDYFRDKYGTANPFYLVEAKNTELWEEGWEADVPACKIFSWRNGVELLPTEGRVYYGHVLCVAPGGDTILVGELVHESELEPVEGEEIDLATSKNLTFENLDPGLFSDEIAVIGGEV